MVTSATAFKQRVSDYMNQGEWLVCPLLEKQPLSLSGWSYRHPYKANDGLGGVFAYTKL